MRSLTGFMVMTLTVGCVYKKIDVDDDDDGGDGPASPWGDEADVDADSDADADADADTGHSDWDDGLPEDFDPTRERSTDDGLYTVTYVPVPDPIPESTEFALTITLNEPDALVTDVDSTMPNHGHGMNVVPVVTNNGDGVFTAAPLEFHMPGYWVLHVDVTGPTGSDQANFDVNCCEEP